MEEMVDSAVPEDETVIPVVVETVEEKVVSVEEMGDSVADQVVQVVLVAVQPVL